MMTCGPRDREDFSVKEHECPSCGSAYCCPRGEPGCLSPRLYDCQLCYQRRHRGELNAMIAQLAIRFGEEPSCSSELRCAL